MKALNYLKRSDWSMFVLIYSITLFITLSYAIYTMKITSDQAVEYDLYTQMVRSGRWTFVKDNIVNSCLTVTLIPALLQRLTNIDASLLFKVFPCFFYSLMPSFVYLISRKYLDKKYSILTALFVLAHFFFMYYPAIGRVGVALGFSAGMLWGIINRRYITASAFAGLLTISHYGTAYFFLFALGITWCILLLRRKFNTDFKTVSIVLVVLILAIGIWHVSIAKASANYSEGFIKSAITFNSVTLDEPHPAPEIPRDKKTTESSRLANFFKLEHRDPTIQAAFGKTLPYMNIPQKIEFVLSWMMVLSLCGGFLLMLYRRQFSETHTIMACIMFSFILITLIIPHISIYYGIGRVYFTSLIALAPCFTIGVQKLAEQIKIRGYVLQTALVTSYALTVSGTTHLLFGIIK